MQPRDKKPSERTVTLTSKMVSSQRVRPEAASVSLPVFARDQPARRQRGAAPAPPSPGAQAPARAHYGHVPGDGRPTRWSAHRPAGSRDPRRPMETKPPHHRDDGGPGLEQPRSAARRPLHSPAPALPARCCRHLPGGEDRRRRIPARGRSALLP